MERTVERHPQIYALEPIDELCDACQQHSTMRVIVLPPAVGSGRAMPPVHPSVLRLVGDDEDDLANATWEDAAWQ